MGRFPGIFDLVVKIGGHSISTRKAVAVGILSCMEDRLRRELLEYRNKGLVFRCAKGTWGNYQDDFAEILGYIEYDLMTQEIKTKQVKKYLYTRLRESLPGTLEETLNRELSGGISIPNIVTIKAQFSKNVKMTFQQAKTLQGLIEGYLHLRSTISSLLYTPIVRSRNLMIIVTKAHLASNDELNLVIPDIFNARTNSGQTAGLTLVPDDPDSIDQENLDHSVIWCVFNPEEEIKECMDFIWGRLSGKQKNLFDSKDVLKDLIIQSKGSKALLYKKWDEAWSKVKKDGREAIFNIDIKRDVTK